MAQNSAEDSVPMSSLLYKYLESCERGLVETFKPAYLQSLPQFSHIDPKLISDYLARWKKKHPMGVVVHKPESAAEIPHKTESKSEPIPLNEDGFVIYLGLLVNNGDPDVRIASLFQSYLKEKEEISKKPKPLMPPNRDDAIGFVG